MKNKAKVTDYTFGEENFMVEYVREKDGTLLENSEPVGCFLAIDLSKYVSKDSPKVISIGYSFRNPLDKYSKHKALQLCSDRCLYLLDSKNYTTKHLDGRPDRIRQLWFFIQRVLNRRQFAGKPLVPWAQEFYNEYKESYKEQYEAEMSDKENVVKHVGSV